MKPLKYFLVFLFIVIGTHSYCQDSSDSIKYLTAERTVKRFGKEKTQSKRYGDFRKMSIVLKDGTKIIGLVYDFTDSTISIGTKTNIKLTEIREISSHGSSFLTVLGGSIMVAGIVIGLTAMLQHYSNIGDLSVKGFFTGFGFMSIGIINQSSRRHFSIKHGWKFKITKEPVPVVIKHN